MLTGTVLAFVEHSEVVSFVSRKEDVRRRSLFALFAIRRHFGKQMNNETKLRIHNITAKAALKFGSEAWVLRKREEQPLEAAQMKFLRHLFRITKLYKEKNQCIREKTEHRT